MKKYILFLLSLIFMVILTGCSSQYVSEHLTEKNGRYYLEMPISKEKALAWVEDPKVLDSIDFDLLKKAEEKITNELLNYDDPGHFNIHDNDDGSLYLQVEVIVDIDPPKKDDSGNTIKGCGYDHEHKFLRENISRKWWFW